jgi:8-oxo-dGTP pyrophosphatase MutT (NUDIX family)
MRTVIKQRLKQALTQRQKHHIVDTSRISSAVLVPIFEKYGEWHILFTKRTERLRDHKGQISFPGGAYEKQDGGFINTALRECAEEIGLSAEAVEVLGELDDMYTLGTYYVISPFVAVIPWPYPFRLDPIEVERIIEAPLSALLNKDCLSEETDTLNGEPITTYFYRYRGDIIWGATARILNQFLDIWTGVLEGNVK